MQAYLIPRVQKTSLYYHQSYLWTSTKEILAWSKIPRELLYRNGDKGRYKASEMVNRANEAFNFCAWGSISRAVIWVLGILPFWTFSHYKLIRMIFNDCGIKTNVIQLDVFIFSSDLKRYWNQYISWILKVWALDSAYCVQWERQSWELPKYIIVPARP